MANVMKKPVCDGSDGTGTQGMTCPECFSVDSFRAQDIEEAVTVGDNTALVRIQASVCQVCGYELLDVKNAEKIEAVYKRLENGDTAGMEAIGTTYRVS